MSDGSRHAAEFTVLAGVRVAIGGLAILKGVTLSMLGLGGGVLAGWMILSAFVLLGYRSRAAALGLVGLSLFLLGSGYESNQSYLLLLLFALLTVSDSERRWAVGGTPDPSGRTWSLGLMRWQLTIVYAFAGLAKINASWLSGCALGTFLGLAAAPLPDVGSVLPVVAIAVVVVELFLAVAPWVRRLQVVAVVVAVGLHVGMLVVAVDTRDLLDLIGFAGLMGVMLWTFFSPDGHLRPHAAPARPSHHAAPVPPPGIA